MSLLLPIAFGGFDAIGGLVVFVLATFLGFEVITKVPTQLHTPLMSGSNAISGIIIVGAILLTGFATDTIAVVLGAVSVALGAINVVGGFVVTDRMLRMFKGKKKPTKAGGAS